MDQVPHWAQSRPSSSPPSRRPIKPPKNRSTAIAIGISILFMLLAGAIFAFAAPDPTPAQYVGMGPRGEFHREWCADFICWALRDDLRAIGVNPTPGARELLNRLRRAGFGSLRAYPGGLVFFWRESPDSWKGHVEWIESVNGKKIVTIGRSGDKVVRSTVSIDHSKIIGYATLKRRNEK